MTQDKEPTGKVGADRGKNLERASNGATKERQEGEGSAEPTEGAITFAGKESECVPENDRERKMGNDVATRSAAWKRRRRLCFEDLLDEEREIGVHKWIIQAGEAGQTKAEQRDMEHNVENSREGVRTDSVGDRQTRQGISVIAPEEWCTEVELEDVTERIAAWK